MRKLKSQVEVSDRLDKTEGRSDAAYRIIRDRILDRTVRPGNPMIEGRLARELGMSRTPVREALKKLEQEGLVISIPGKGFFVETLSPGDVAEIYDMREMVEGLAARLLSRRMTPDIAEMLMELAARADSPSATVVDDMEFHSAIVRLCGSRRANEAIRFLSLNVLAYDEHDHRLTLNSGVPLLGRGWIQDAHRNVAEKIISGNPREAEEAARAHVRRRRPEGSAPRRRVPGARAGTRPRWRRGPRPGLCRL